MTDDEFVAEMVKISDNPEFLARLALAGVRRALTVGALIGAIVGMAIGGALVYLNGVYG